MQVALIGFGHRRENRVPDADLPPPDEPVIAGGVRAIALGDVCPRRTRAKPLVDAIQNLTGHLLAARRAACSAAEGRDRPLKVRDLVAAWVHRDASPTP